MLEDLRRPVVGRNQNVGKRLVVTQQYVEARPQAFDQIGFQQQRLGLGRGRDEFHRNGCRDHARDARVVGHRPRIGRDPLLDALGLADIEHLAFGVDHAIDARAGRRMLDGPHDRRAAAGQGTGGRLIQVEFRQRRFVVFAQFFLAELACRIDVFFAAAHGLKDSVWGAEIYSATSSTRPRHCRPYARQDAGRHRPRASCP